MRSQRSYLEFLLETRDYKMGFPVDETSTTAASSNTGMASKESIYVVP